MLLARRGGVPFSRELAQPARRCCLPDGAGSPFPGELAAARSPMLLARRGRVRRRARSPSLAFACSNARVPSHHERRTASPPSRPSCAGAGGSPARVAGLASALRRGGPPASAAALGAFHRYGTGARARPFPRGAQPSRPSRGDRTGAGGAFFLQLGRRLARKGAAGAPCGLEDLPRPGPLARRGPGPVGGPAPELAREGPARAPSELPGGGGYISQGQAARCGLLSRGCLASSLP